jgi:hypothetical protein
MGLFLRSSLLLASSVTALAACGPGGSGQSSAGAAGSGGSPGSGGMATGGMTSTGGMATGGSAGSGGMATGGSTSTGGMTAPGPGTCVPPGFSLTPHDFPVPPGYMSPLARPFKRTLNQDTASCGAGYDVPMYGLADMDGDGELDMVVTERCGDAAVGASKWLFHKGAPGGFAQSPSDLALPTGYLAPTGKPLHLLANQGTASCGAGYDVPEYGLLDLDGDKRLDLVITDRCNDPATGSSRWLVHKAGPAGFAAAAADVALPSGYFSQNGKPLHLLQNQDTAACGAGYNVPAYALIDLDGDGLRDLVITDRCNDPATGSSKWLVHQGIPGGFAAAPVDFALPAGYFAAGTKPFRLLRNQVSAACGAGNNAPAYSVLDTNGDGRLDLVLTDRCNDPATGSSKWLVHLGTPSGFAAAPTDFALPAGFSSFDGKPFRFLATQTAACGGGFDAPAYATLDIDGDLHRDLVVTESCDDAAVGVTKWLVYRGDCAP